MDFDRVKVDHGEHVVRVKLLPVAASHGAATATSHCHLDDHSYVKEDVRHDADIACPDAVKVDEDDDPAACSSEEMDVDNEDSIDEFDEDFNDDSQRLTKFKEEDDEEPGDAPGSPEHFYSNGSAEDDPMGQQVTYVTSRWQNRLACLHGHCYSHVKASKQCPELHFWMCVNRAFRCNARLHLSDGLVVGTFSRHNHDPDAIDISLREAMQRIREEAGTGHKRADAIVCDETINLPDAVALALPKRDSLKRLIQRCQSKVLDGKDVKSGNEEGSGNASDSPTHFYGNGSAEDDPIGQQVTYVTSRLQNRLACLHGHCYSHVKASKQCPELHFWRCVNRAFKCNARLHLSNGLVVGTFSHHNHDPDAIDISRREAMQRIREEAGTGHKRADAIVRGETLNLPDAVALALPKGKLLKRFIHRLQRKVLDGKQQQNLKANEPVADPADGDVDEDIKSENEEGRGDALDSPVHFYGSGSAEDDPIGQHVTYVTSRQQNRLACLHGHCYLYEKDSKQRPELNFWRCVNRAFKCNARLHLSDGLVVGTFSCHNHDPDAINISCREAMHRIREAAGTGHKRADAIVCDETLNLKDAVALALPKDTSLKRLIRRHRIKNLEGKQHKKLKVEEPVAVSADGDVDGDEHDGQGSGDAPGFPVHDCGDVDTEDYPIGQQVTYVTSRWRNRLACLDGHCYFRVKASKQHPEVHFWRCVKRTLKCKARLHLSDRLVVGTFSHHNHDHDDIDIRWREREALHRMREEAETGQARTNVIVRVGTRNLLDAVASTLPKDNSPNS